MFSKPIVAASFVASAHATLIMQSAVAYPSTQVATYYSTEIGCGECLSYTDGNWVSKDNAFGTIDAAETVTLSSNKVTGGICCKDTSSKESASSSTFCAAGMTTANGNIIIKATDAAGKFQQSIIAQCPHQKDNCQAAAVKADGTTAINLSDERYIELDEVKSSVTLKLNVLSSPGTAPSQKQRRGDVCSWVVVGKCDAPVLTVPKTSATMTAFPSNEYFIQVTEWSAEFTNAASDNTWATLSGATGKLYYPPINVDLSSVVTDLQVDLPNPTAPNNIYGEVLYKTPAKDGTTYISVPGNTLIEWMQTVKAQYDIYDADVKAYNTDNDLWKKYAEYEAPTPGLLDGIFGATEDPDKPKARSSPLVPTQPVDVPDYIKNLELGASTAPSSPAEYTSKAGYGHPQAYTILPVAGKSVKPWGTLAGGGQSRTASVDVTDADSLLSMRRTSNKKDGKYITDCDKSYLFITGLVNGNPSAAKTFELLITAQEFASNLEEQVPTRPSAVTAPVAAPAGATQLAASAIAAALIGLYLF